MMIRRWFLISIVPVLALVVGVPVLLVVGLASTASATSGCPVGQTANITPGSGGLDAVQTANAATIIGTGIGLHVPTFGLQIAIAVARQESSLHNLANDSIPASLALTTEGSGSNADSLGLMQQRSSWGSVVQRMTPSYAATKFFRALLGIPGWQKMALTVAAQAVQHSGTPTAYAAWTALAQQVVAGVTGGVITGGCTRTVSTTVSGAAGVAIAHAEQALGTMYSWGGNCSDPHSTDPALHCDCSSLAMTAYAAAGITIPRTSEQQWLTLPHVPGVTAANVLTLVHPGDLIYYEWGADGIAAPGHVALSIGGGKLIEASQPGAPVAIRPIYTSSFVGLTRSFQ